MIAEDTVITSQLGWLASKRWRGLYVDLESGSDECRRRRSHRLGESQVVPVQSCVTASVRPDHLLAEASWEHWPPW